MAKKKEKKGRKIKSIYDCIYDPDCNPIFETPIPGYGTGYRALPGIQNKIDFFKDTGAIKTAKKGGRIGKPKGVGVAKRGYGKAMKRGK